jgi:hypothetical protein
MSWRVKMFASWSSGTRDDGAQMACVVMCGRQYIAVGCHVRAVLVNCLLL